jgi:hypothetical protein
MAGRGRWPVEILKNRRAVNNILRKQKMKNCSTRFFLGLILLLSSIPAMSMDEIDDTSSFIAKSIFIDDLQNHEERKKFVELSKLYCSSIENAVQRNSSNEELWLSEEIDSGAERAVKALNSKEYARKKIHDFTNSCLSAADIYLRETNKENTAALIALSYAFSRFDDNAEIYAERAGIDPARFALHMMEAVTDATIYSSLMSAMRSP